MTGSWYEVEVRPSAAGWGARMEAQVGPQVKAFAEQIKRQLQEAVRDGLNGNGLNIPNNPRVRQQGQGQGKQYADAFAREVQTRLERAVQQLPEMKLRADSSAVEREIIDIRRQLAGTVQQLEFGVDPKSVETQVARLKARLAELSANATDVRVRINTEAALRQVEAFQAGMRGVGVKAADNLDDAFSRTLHAKLEASLSNLPRVKIDANSSDLDRELAAVRRKLAAAVKGVELGVDDKLVEASVAELSARLKRLSAESPDIRVRVNAGAALAEIEKMKEEVDKLDGREAKVKVKVDRTADLKLLQTALTLAPAALPLVGGVLAAATQAVGVAGVAGLAIAGIKSRADAASTDMVQSQINALQPLVKEWMRVAAVGAAPGITAGIRALGAAGPDVTRIVHQLANEVGWLAEGLGSGLAKSLHIVTPMLVQGEDAVREFAARLSKGPAEDGGFVKFLDYAGQNLPATIAFLEHLGSTLGHVVEAAAPLGSVTLEIVDGLVELVGAIPTPVLTAFLTALTAYRLSAFAAALATKTFGASFAGVLGPIGATVAALTALGVALNDSQSGSDRGLSGLLAQIKNAATNAHSIQDQLDAGKDPTAHQSVLLSGGLDDLRTIFGASGGIADQNKQADELRASLEAAIPPALKLGNAIGQLQIANSLNHTADMTGDIDSLGKSFNQLTGFLDEYLSSAQALDGFGNDMTTTFGKATYSTSEYNKALAVTKGNQVAAIALLNQNRATASQLSNKIAEVAAMQQTLNDVVGDASYKYKLTSDQVSLYAKAIGISGIEIATGTVSQYAFERSIGAVAATLRNANEANQAWLDAVSKFDPATATAADTAGLLAAALDAARGDALSYATSLSTADQATQGVAKSIHDNLSSISADGTLLGVSYLNASGQFVQAQGKFVDGSAQILGGFTSITQSATAAAAATYQHEAALGDTQRAAQDAMTVYAGYRQSLIDQAMQSGATADQAQALADKYFAMPKDVDTFVKMLGQGDVTTAIANLTTALNNLAGKIATPTVSLNDWASGQIDDIGRKLYRLNGASATVYVQTAGGKAALPSAAGNFFESVPGYAAGGFLDGLSEKMRAAVPSFAGGTERHLPQIAMPGAQPRLWLEPETRGEAYVPLANDWRRPRAEYIVGKLAQRFGGAYLNRANVAAMAAKGSLGPVGAGSGSMEISGRLALDAGSIGVLTTHVAAVADGRIALTASQQALASSAGPASRLT